MSNYENELHDRSFYSSYFLNDVCKLIQMAFESFVPREVSSPQQPDGLT